MSRSSPQARGTAALGGVVAMIAVVTAASRLVGFLRTWLLAQTVGTSCLGTAYTTANAVPNLVFEIIVGGALAGSVVPLLAGPLARSDLTRARAITAALYGWVLVVLVPAAVVVAVAAGPITGLLLGDGGEAGCAAGAVADTASAMLVIFAVQIPIYGLTVVAQGSLQSAHRFLATALAPLLSSLVVMAAYLGYAQLAGDRAGDVVGISGSELAVLAVGTTVGVAVLLLTQLPATVRSHLAVRPALHFPEGVAARARPLAVAGLMTVAGQWLAYGVSLRLVNDRGPEGAAVVYLLAWTVFLLPWAVLVFPLAMGVFPRLAAMHEQGQQPEFAASSAGLFRGPVLLATL
ncbi:MAG: lipid II flippase MurJ, partial [Actinomycetes bacterium]